MIDERIKRQAKRELARREFFYFCNLMASDFYKPERRYLVELCEALQSFYEDEKAKVLIINEPPRHGKSRTASLFVEWVLGRNPSEKIMTGSYNNILSATFAKNVRNAIQEVKADENITVYSDIFPNVRIKRGDAAMDMWSLDGGYNSYLATSPSGTATGFGCSLLIIDDIIKNAEEAYNETAKEKAWLWFTNTMLSRLEEGGKILIIMTRWASDDLAGRAIEHFGDAAKVITMQALQPDGSMLCDEILSRRSYEEKVRAMGADIASANYQQEPIDIKGQLYSTFKTYDRVPTDVNGNPLFTSIRNYTDTADTGTDSLCSIVYGVYEGEAYVLDVLHTDEAMEITEPATAAMLYRNGVNVADFESNNGGRGFARQVRRILQDTYKSNKTVINTFAQTKNKVARILSNSTWVMEHIYFPVNWKDRWPEYYKAMTRYQREGKNAHDDAPDATTGIAEKMNEGERFSFW
ncbi:MAG: phage terminase large subunit [Megasphaera micronuciformis]